MTEPGLKGMNLTVVVFATAIFCMLLLGRLPRWRAGLSLMTALLSVFGFLSGLIAGATLQQLLIPFLILLWLELRFCINKKA